MVEAIETLVGRKQWMWQVVQKDHQGTVQRVIATCPDGKFGQHDAEHIAYLWNESIRTPDEVRA